MMSNCGILVNVVWMDSMLANIAQYGWFRECD